MKKIKLINILLLTLFIGGMAYAKKNKSPSSSQENQKVETNLKKVEGQIKWIGYGVGKSHAGTINVKSGEVILGDKDIPKQISFVLDMKSIDTKDSEKLKNHLKNSDFFDVEKYPEATFKSTETKVIDGPKDGVASFKIKGDLTIKDKTTSIEFIANIVKKDGVFSATADTEISDRTKYGIVYHSKQFETVSKLGDKLIEDQIKINIEVKAQK